jgi:hypothetical protein
MMALSQTFSMKHRALGPSSDVQAIFSGGRRSAYS